MCGGAYRALRRAPDAASSVRARLVAAKASNQKPERARQRGFELVGEPSQILRWAEDEQINMPEAVSCLGRHAVD